VLVKYVKSLSDVVMIYCIVAAEWSATWDTRSLPDAGVLDDVRKWP